MLHQVRLVSEGSQLNQNICDAVTLYNLALVSVKNPLTTQFILGKYFAAERF